MPESTHRLVIGLDFGTTYTGFAYCEKKESSDVKVDDISLVLDWPAETNEKVPSEIAYTGNGIRWGSDIPHNATKLAWTKLELDDKPKRLRERRALLDVLEDMGRLDLERLRRNDGLPSYPGKDPVEIVTDYLCKVREHAWESLLRTYPSVLLSTIPIDLVVTVPAVWSDVAKDRTFRAVTAAGFNKNKIGNLREILMVSEPEAAAIYTLKSLKDSFQGQEISIGDCFVLCDAGGGTVDLISYRVRSKSPDFRVEEAALGKGDKCGGTFVDREFREWLKERLGEENYSKISNDTNEGGRANNTFEPKIMKVMKEFTTIKMSFNGQPVERGISLPKPLNNLDDDPEMGIVDGEIMLNQDDLREIFEPCVRKTLKLIRGQVEQVKRSGSSIKYIFLVGGFGRSIYLFNRVQEYAESQGIKAMHPLHPWSAVARGAVARGLADDGQDLIYLRKCRRHYGVSISQPFSRFWHEEEDAYFDQHTGAKMAGNQMSWLVKKSDTLISDQPKHLSIEVYRTFYVGSNRVFKTNLWACDKDDAPGRSTEDGPYIVTSFTFDLNSVPESRFKRATSVKGKPYYTAYYRLEIKLDTRLKFWASFDGEEMGSVEVSYE